MSGLALDKKILNQMISLQKKYTNQICVSVEEQIETIKNVLFDFMLTVETMESVPETMMMPFYLPKYFTIKDVTAVCRGISKLGFQIGYQDGECWYCVFDSTNKLSSDVIKIISGTTLKYCVFIRMGESKISSKIKN